MTTTPAANNPEAKQDDLLPEYDFDYSQAKPNRFAARLAGDRVIVVLDPDVAAVFSTADSVNAMLRAIIQNLEKAQGSSVG